MSAATVLAAGAVCWREREGGTPEVLLIHRPGHGDISLPKGKVDPGETLPETAVREIAEETGYVVGLGVALGVVSYDLPGGKPKEVYYWSAEVETPASEDDFSANSEVDELLWVTVDEARAQLSYPHDVEIVDRFAELHERGDARSFAIIALRHGKALPLSDWDGPDATRPLLQRGTDQALSVAPGIAAYRPGRLASSTAERCLGTLAPVARLTGLDVRDDERLSQDAYRSNGNGPRKVVRKRIERGVTTVLCSHGPVIPQVLQSLAELTDSAISRKLQRAAALSTAEYAVVHLSREYPEHGILAVEIHSPTA